MHSYQKFKPALFSIILVFILFAIIFAMLSMNPVFLRRIGIPLRFGFTLVFPALLIVFSAVLYLPKHWGKWIAIAIVSITFSLPLIGVWASGMTDSYILSGTIPLSDAAGYFSNAMQFPQTGVFSDFASRRPLYNGLLVGVASFLDFNLIEIQSILIGMAALVCALMLIKLTDFLHPVSSALVISVIFLYFRRFSGVISSETLGFTLGILGFFFLWDSIREKKLSVYLLGLFLTTLALLTRAGAFIILPMIILWGIFYLRKPEFPVFKFILVSFVPLFVAYLINKSIFVAFGATDGVAFSNYSYSLYGLAKGGAYWTQIFEDHPELLNLPNNEQARLAYQLAMKLIIENPVQFLTGILHEWKLFFSETYFGIWSFISPQPLQAANKSIPKIISHIGLYGLSVAGILRFIRNRKCAYCAFMVFAFIGFLLSVPLAPPSHAYGLRVFAGSIWVLGLLPAIGLDGLIPITWRKESLAERGFQPQLQFAALGLAGVIVLSICIGPLLAFRIDDVRTSLVTDTDLCDEESERIYLSYHPQSTVIIEREDTFFWMGVLDTIKDVSCVTCMILLQLNMLMISDSLLLPS